MRAGRAPAHYAPNKSFYWEKKPDITHKKNVFSGYSIDTGFVIKIKDIFTKTTNAPYGTTWAEPKSIYAFITKAGQNLFADKGVHFGSLDLIKIWILLRIIFVASSLLLKYVLV